MSLNNNWNNNKADAAGSEQQPAKNLDKMGLVALFQQTSMTSDNRNLKDVTDVREQVIDFYKTQRNSTTSELQQMIIPDVEAMTATISPQLPGLCFYREINGQLYVMGVLFSNNTLAISTEQINVNSFGNMNVSRISIPVTPTDHANGQILEGIRNHYTNAAATRSVNAVTLIGMVVVDLEMYDHTEIADVAARTDAISNWLSREWEESIMVKAAEQATEQTISLPNPFKEGKAYGAADTAEARVTVIAGRLNQARQLSPANMEVVVSTMNPNNTALNIQNSKEIVRVKATVSLKGMDIREHQANMIASQNHQAAFQQFMGMNGSIYPQGYRPLRPTITIDAAQPGEQMNYNGGLMPFFFGLYTLMCTNNNYVFAEPLRRVNVGARGNLSDLELRINTMLSVAGIAPNIPNRILLNEKNISDTDVVNQWIRQNIAPQATFQVNLVPRGSNNSVVNFLMRLTAGKRDIAVNTLMNVLDAMSGGQASIIEARNKATFNGNNASKAWHKESPILIRTAEIVVNGLAKYADKQLNTLELDEMMLCHVKGKNGIASITEYLTMAYGITNEESKVRAQKIRRELNESIFDGAVHINAFSQVHIFDPNFMQFIGEVMDKTGTLNVSNTMGSFRTTNLVYAPGAGLATYAVAGNNNAPGSMVASGFSMAVPFA